MRRTASRNLFSWGTVYRFFYPNFSVEIVKTQSTLLKQQLRSYTNKRTHVDKPSLAAGASNQRSRVLILRSQLKCWGEIEIPGPLHPQLRHYISFSRNGFGLFFLVSHFCEKICNNYYNMSYSTHMPMVQVIFLGLTSKGRGGQDVSSLIWSVILNTWIWFKKTSFFISGKHDREEPLLLYSGKNCFLDFLWFEDLMRKLTRVFVQDSNNVN